MSAPLAVSILGAGRMGGNHARALLTLPGAKLHRIFDRDQERAEELASQTGAVAARDLDHALAGADAVVIAASSNAHAVLAQQAMLAGLPVLIEKPFAVTAEEAQTVLAVAARTGVPAVTGHIERFNPAFLAAQKLVAGRRLLAIDARRLNMGSKRILDTDVVIDLMIHDIDAAVALMGGTPQGLTMVQGFGEGGKGDHVLAAWTQRTPDPVYLSMLASRCVPDRVRETRILAEGGAVIVDFLNRSVLASASLLPDGPREGGGLVSVVVPRQEALSVELSVFLDAVRAGKPEAAGVEVAAAFPVLTLVWAIQRQFYGG